MLQPFVSANFLLHRNSRLTYSVQCRHQLRRAHRSQDNLRYHRLMSRDRLRGQRHLSGLHQVPSHSCPVGRPLQALPPSDIVVA